MPADLVTEFRLIIERTLPRDSRVMQDTIPLRNADDAANLARYWSRPCAHGLRGWVETRTVSLWEPLNAR